MTSRVNLACEKTLKSISISDILPTKKITKIMKSSLKYRQIAASMRAVGIIEPIVVHRQRGPNSQYLLLDGHVRLEILRELGTEQVDCLLATEDEAFTYNHKVNRLTAIQEHFMIEKAIRSGVPEQAIAEALDVDVSRILKKRDLLDGICPEAVELLRGRSAGAGAFAQLRKAKPIRQIEMAELMCASNNMSADYAKCLLAATPADQLVDGNASKNGNVIHPDDIARMERELKSITNDFKRLDESYGKIVLDLVIVKGYLKKLLDNGRVVRYIAQGYPDLLAEFQKVVDSPSIENSSSDIEHAPG